MKQRLQAFFTEIRFTKVQLAVLVLIYIYFLNFFVSFSFEKIFSALWVALLFLGILLIFSLTHRYVFKAFLALQILIASLAVFAKQKYQITITEDILLSALISENDLTAEMISLPLIIWFFITAILPIMALCLVTIKQVKFYKQLIHNILLMGGGSRCYFWNFLPKRL